MSLFKEVDNEIKEIKKENRHKLDELIKSSKMYRPSNATEGAIFENTVCEGCKKYNNCQVLIKLAGGKVKEIREKDNVVFCINHTNFNVNIFN